MRKIVDPDEIATKTRQIFLITIRALCRIHAARLTATPRMNMK